MDKWIKNNKCLTRQELVVSVILKTQVKEGKIRHRWEIPCTMATSWKTSDKAMLDNKMWIISKLSNIMEDSHLTKWIIKTSPTQVTEMVQAPSVSTQVALAATESEQLMELPKIIKPICSIWSTKGKHQMVIRTTNNKWWWPLNNSSTLHLTITRWYRVWTPQVKTPLKLTLILRQLLKLNFVSSDRTVEQATQSNMRTACLFKVMVTTKIWMPLSISITTERDLSKEVLVILQM